MNNDYEALISRVAAACAVPRHHVAIAYGHEAPWSVCDSTIYGSGPWSIGVKYKLAWTSGFFETQGRGASLAEAESKVMALVRRA